MGKLSLFSSYAKSLEGSLGKLMSAGSRRKGIQYTFAQEGRFPRYKYPCLLTWAICSSLYSVETEVSGRYCGAAVSSQPPADGLSGIFAPKELNPWKR